jgi:hypothetical protein
MLSRSSAIYYMNITVQESENGGWRWTLPHVTKQVKFDYYERSTTEGSNELEIFARPKRRLEGPMEILTAQYRDLDPMNQEVKMVPWLSRQRMWRKY